MSRRRSKKQDPDAVDVEQERVLQNAGASSVDAGPQSALQNGPKGRKPGKKATPASAPSNLEAEPQGGVLRDEPESFGPAIEDLPKEEVAKSDATEEKSPLSATTHPFWSEKAKLEVALAQARPSDLDAEAQCFSGGDLERTRPIDLEERGRSRQEVVVNEEVKDPEYGSALGAMASAEVRKSLDVGMSSPERSEFVEVSPSAGLEGQSQRNVSERTEGDDPIQDASRLVQQRRSSEELVLDDQALEIARLRSMVDFLQGHIQYTEESRSYESSSNQAMDPVVAVQDSRPVQRPPNEQGPPIASTIPATPYFVQEPSGIPVPPVFNLSSKPARDPFQECVMVQGMPHRWVRVGDKLYLEPLVLHSREGSPPPPPPKTTPPPSPPPLPITSSPYNPVNPAPEAPNPWRSP